MSERSDKIKALAESWADKFLAWRMGLPAPLTAITELALWGLAFYGGVGVARLFG